MKTSAKSRSAHSSHLSVANVAMLVTAAFWGGIALHDWLELAARWPVPEPDKIMSLLFDLVVPLLGRLLPHGQRHLRRHRSLRCR